MADQEVIKHVKHAMEVARNPQFSWTKKLREIMQEVVIIVFAVSLSIWLHSWAESRKDREEERDFMIGLKKDLQADILEMKSDQDSYQTVLNGMAYFVRIGKGESVDADSIKIYLPTLFSTVQIDPRVARFEALRGSGRMGIVRDKELLVTIADLYTKDFPHLRRVNEFMSTLRTDKMLPFFAAHLEVDRLGTGATNIEKVLRLSESRVLISALASAATCITDYQQVIDKSNLIIKEIDKDIE